MARHKQGSVPGLRHHKPSGKAVVTLSGQDHYCGTWGTKTALCEYDRHVSEWLARGRRPFVQDDCQHGPISIVELLAAYKRHVEAYYVKDGKQTSEVNVILSALRVVRQMYGREAADSFDSLKLQAVQQAMIRKGWARQSINRQTSRIVRMFAWGTAQKLIKGAELTSLREVRGLHKGKTEARESLAVMPVDEPTIQSTLHHLPPIVADMVRLQRLTGCRPDEICQLRPCDVDASGDVWAYRPQSHKTQHHGRERVIFIGPRGQEILRPYLLRDKSSYCFCPADGERKRRAEAHERRKTPIGYGNRPGTNKRSKPKRTAGERYDTDAYRRAITRACELAFGMPDELRNIDSTLPPEQQAAQRKEAAAWRAAHCWAPNQLRHSAATEIRKQFGLEAAQVTLGHAGADVSQIYAERDLAKAAQIMSKIG